MAEWLRQNWGNLASMIGLVISVVAWWKARSAQAAVQAVHRRERLFRILLDSERSLHHARRIQESKAVHWPQAHCDALRESLGCMLDNRLLTEDESARVQTAIASLRMRVENNMQAQAWIRRLIDCLIGMQNRVTDRLREQTNGD